MTYLIHGATGAQGAPVAAVLAHAGKSVAAAVRNPSTYAGVGESVAVDFTDTDSLQRAYRGLDGVFVHLPVGSNDHQMRHAQTILAALEQARPARVVVSSSGYPNDAEGAAETPVGTLARGLRDSGLSFAVIEPRLFLENLLFPSVVGPARQEGVLHYPIRDDYALSWSSHLDVADVAARLFADHSVVGSVAVGALPGLVGDDLAVGFAHHFDREVRFQSQSPDDFGAEITPLFGEAAAAPVVDSYRWRATQHDELIDANASAQQLLGLAPRTVEQWLRDIDA